MDTSNSALSPPDSASWVKRRAKLFEAGEYPDKGVTVTQGHIAALARSFSEPVPLLIEHAESPLEMGFLSHVEQEGNELFGLVSLTPEADALVERSGARSLSLGLTPDLSAIREVSLVRSPRVESARLFGGDVRFVASLELDTSFRASSEWRLLREARVDRELEDLARSGRMCPAQREFARALMLVEDTLQFNGEAKPIAHLVRSLLERQPRANLFGDLAPAVGDYSANLLLPEEAEFYRRHFPEVSLSEIAKRK